MNVWFKKLISVLVLSLFTVNTCFADVAGMGIEFSAKTEIPKLIQIDIPAELASVEEFWEAPARPNPKMILQIQNAHTNYEAQSKIRDLMSYLNQNYGFKTIFVEGASEELNPDYLKLFSDAETNKKLWDELAKRGQITGADWFLLSDEKGGARGVGIENADLYRQNYEALKAVYSREAETAKFVSGLESELDKLASKTLPPETRKVIAEWKKFEKGHREFIPFVEGLARLAKESAELDLRGLYSQIEWPQLTRLLVLQNMEKKLNQQSRSKTGGQRPEGTKELSTLGVRGSGLRAHEAAEVEKKQMLDWLKANGVSSELIEGLERFDEKSINMNRIRASSGKMESLPRFFVEKLVEEAGPKGLKFSNYPNFALYTGYLILKYEIEPTALFGEIRKLFDRLLETSPDAGDRSAEEGSSGLRAPASGREKDLINLFQDAELVRKLLNLELSREEWQKVISRKEALAPADLFQRVKSLSQEVQGQTPEGTKELRTLGVSGSGHSDYQQQILTAFENAFSFYDLAIRRDEVFYEKMAKELETTDRAILMTGGFHTEGLREIFREKEISYGTITPRLTQVEKSNLYRDVMLGKSNFSGQRQAVDNQTVEIWSLLNQAGLNPDQAGFSVEQIEYAIRDALKGKNFDGNRIAAQLNKGLFNGQKFEILYNGRKFEIKFRSEAQEGSIAAFNNAIKNQKNEPGYQVAVRQAHDLFRYLMSLVLIPDKEHRAILEEIDMRFMDGGGSYMRGSRMTIDRENSRDSLISQSLAHEFGHALHTYYGFDIPKQTMNLGVMEAYALAFENVVKVKQSKFNSGKFRANAAIGELLLSFIREKGLSIQELNDLRINSENQKKLIEELVVFAGKKNLVLGASFVNQMIEMARDADYGFFHYVGEFVLLQIYQNLGMDIDTLTEREAETAAKIMYAAIQPQNESAVNFTDPEIFVTTLSDSIAGQWREWVNLNIFVMLWKSFQIFIKNIFIGKQAGFTEFKTPQNMTWVKLPRKHLQYQASGTTANVSIAAAAAEQVAAEQTQFLESVARLIVRVNSSEINEGAVGVTIFENRVLKQFVSELREMVVFQKTLRSKLIQYAISKGEIYPISVNMLLKSRSEFRAPAWVQEYEIAHSSGNESIKIWLDQELEESLLKLQSGTSITIFGSAAIYFLLAARGALKESPLKDIASDLDLVVRQNPGEHDVADALSAFAARITPVEWLDELTQQNYTINQLFLNVQVKENGGQKYLQIKLDDDVGSSSDFKIISNALDDLSNLRLIWGGTGSVSLNRALRGLRAIFRYGLTPQEQTVALMKAGLDAADPVGDQEAVQVRAIFKLLATPENRKILADLDFFRGKLKERLFFELSVASQNQTWSEFKENWSIPDGEDNELIREAREIFSGIEELKALAASFRSEARTELTSSAGTQSSESVEEVLGGRSEMPAEGAVSWSNIGSILKNRINTEFQFVREQIRVFAPALVIVFMLIVVIPVSLSLLGALGLSAATASILSSIILAPIIEEIMFRKLIFKKMMDSGMGFLASASASAFLFAVIHGVLFGAGGIAVTAYIFLQLFSAGVTYAYLYHRTGNLLAPMAMHSLTNSFILLGIGLGDPLISKIPIIIEFIATISIFTAFSIKLKNTAWFTGLIGSEADRVRSEARPGEVISEDGILNLENLLAAVDQAVQAVLPGAVIFIDGSAASLEADGKIDTRLINDLDMVLAVPESIVPINPVEMVEDELVRLWPQYFFNVELPRSGFRRVIKGQRQPLVMRRLALRLSEGQDQPFLRIDIPLITASSSKLAQQETAELDIGSAKRILRQDWNLLPAERFVKNYLYLENLVGEKLQTAELKAASSAKLKDYGSATEEYWAEMKGLIPQGRIAELSKAFDKPRNDQIKAIIAARGFAEKFSKFDVRSEMRPQQAGQVVPVLINKGDQITGLVRGVIAQIVQSAGKQGNDNIRVLEMGIGSGVLTKELQSAVRNPQQIQFIGFDINPSAVQAAKEALGDEFDARESDLFSAVRDGEKFDVIFWNPPWYSEASGGNLALAKNDPGFETLRRFLGEASQYLKPNGKVFLILPEVSMGEIWEDTEKNYTIERADGYKTTNYAVGLYELTPARSEIRDEDFDPDSIFEEIQKMITAVNEQRYGDAEALTTAFGRKHLFEGELVSRITIGLARLEAEYSDSLKREIIGDMLRLNPQIERDSSEQAYVVPVLLGALGAVGGLGLILPAVFAFAPYLTALVVAAGVIGGLIYFTRNHIKSLKASSLNPNTQTTLQWVAQFLLQRLGIEEKQADVSAISPEQKLNETISLEASRSEARVIPFLKKAAIAAVIMIALAKFAPLVGVYLAGIALVVGAVQTLTEWWGAGTSNSEKKVGVKEGIRLEVLIPGTPEQILQEKIKPWIYIVLALGYFLVMTVVHAISVGDFLAQGQQKDKTAAMALQVEANLGSRNFSENAKLVSGSIMSVIDQIYPSASEQEKKDLHDLALFQTGMESGLFQYADQKNWKEAGHPSIDIAKGIFQHEVTRSRTLGDHVMTWLGYPSKEGDVRRIDQEFLAKKLELTSQGESQPSYKAIVELREAAIKRFPNDAGLQAEYIARALAYRVMQLDLMDDYELDAFFFFVKEKRVKSRMAKNGDTLRDMAQNLEDGVFNDKYFRTKPSPASKKQEIADAIKDHTFGYGGRQGWNVVLATAVSEPQANTSSRVASVDEILALPKWDSERGFLEESLLFPTLDQPAVARQDLPAVARTPSAVESELVATVPLEVFSSELAQVENQVPSANLSWYQREIALPFAQWAARIAPDGGLPVQVFFAGAVLYLIGALFRAAIFNFKKTPSSYSNMTTAVGRSSMSLALSGSVYAYSVVGVELANKWIGTNILIGRLTTAELVMVIEAPILIFFAMLIFGKIKYGKEFALGRVFAKGFLPREAFAPKPRSEKEVVSARSEARGVAQPLTRREAIRRSLLFAAGIGTGGLVANYGLKQVNIGINSPDLASTTSSGDLFFDLRSWNIEVMRFEDAQNDSDAQIISPANFFLEDKQPTGFLRLQEEEPIVDFNHNLSEKAMAKAMFFIDGTGRPHIFDYQKYAENPELYGVQLYPIGFQAGPWIKIGEDLNLGIEVWHKGLQGGRRVAIGYDRLGRFFFKEFYGPDFMGKMGMSTDSFMTELHAWLSRNSIESAMFVDGGTTGFGVGQKTPPYVIVARSKGRSEMRVADQSPEEIADWVVDLSQGTKNKTEEWSAAGFPGPFSNYPLFMREFPVERFHAVLSVLRARKEYDAGKWFAKSMLDSLLGYGMQNTEFLADLPQYYDYFNLNDANPESEFNKNLDFFERRTAAVQYGVSTALKEQVLKLAFEAFGVRRDPNEEYEMEPKFDAEGHSFRNQFVRDLNLAFMIALKSAGEKGILWDPALLPFLFQLSNSNSVMRIRNGGYAGELDVIVQVSGQQSKFTAARNKNEVLIGRGSSNDLIVQDASVSRSHLVLRRDKDNPVKFRLNFTGKNRPLLWPDAERSSLDQRRSEMRYEVDTLSFLDGGVPGATTRSVMNVLRSPRFQDIENVKEFFRRLGYEELDLNLNGTARIFNGYDGTSKYGFRIDFGRVSGRSLSLMFKVERVAGTIPSEETADLKKISHQYVPMILSEGQTQDGLHWMIEEFIDGIQFSEVLEESELTLDEYRGYLRTVLGVGKDLDFKPPSDIRYQNFIWQKDRKKMILIDLGGARFDLEDSAKHRVYFLYTLWATANDNGVINTHQIAADLFHDLWSDKAVEFSAQVRADLSSYVSPTNMVSDSAFTDTNFKSWFDGFSKALRARSEMRVFLDSNGYLQTEPVSYDFFNALAAANDVSEAAKIVKKEISNVAAELRQLIQQNGFIPNKIGNGERSVFNTQELREKEKIGLNDADLLALLQSDKEEMLALAESYGQEQGHSFTVDKINEKIVDRMVDILAEAIWTYVKRHEAWVEWGRRLQALDSFLDKQEEAELSAAVAVFDVGQFLSSSGGYVFGGSRLGRGIFRGQVDALVDFARQGSVQPQHLRLNFFSIALASLGYFQKGPPSAHSPDQAYPVSPAQFWNDHIKNSRTNLFEHPDTQKFIREISEDEKKAKQVIQQTALLIEERQLKKSIRDRTLNWLAAGVVAIVAIFVVLVAVKKLSKPASDPPATSEPIRGLEDRSARSEIRAEASEEFISAVENLIGKPISKAETFNLDGETLNLIEAFERLQQAANKWSETESYDLEIQGEPGKNVQIYLLRDGKRLVDLDGLPTFSREYQNLAMGILAEIQRKVRKHKPSTQITITLLEAENDAEIEDYNPSIVEVSLEQPGPRKESLIKLQPKPFKANSKVDGPGILFLNHVGLRKKENTDDANQDRFMNFTVKTKMGQAAVMAVFDGHGKRGAEAAEQAQNLLKLELETILARVDAATSDDDWRAQIESAFQRVSLEMNKKGYLQSGTTASIAVVVGGRIVMISLGDSPIMVVDRSQPQNPISKKSTLNHVGDQNSKTAMDLKLMKSIRADADKIDLISRGWGLNGDFYFFPNGTQMKVLSALGHGDEPAVGTEPEVEFFNLELGGDYFLMVASDGILTLESDDQNAKTISEAVAPGLSNEEVFAGLLARHRGTPMDNLTMYLANVRELIGRSEMRVVQGFDVFVSKETWAAMASWPIVLGNKISLTGFNDFYEVQLIDPSGQPAVLLGVDNQPLKFVLKIYQDGEGTHKLREATEVGVYEKIMQAAIDQPIEGQPGSWIHIPAGLMGGVFRGGDNDSMYEVDPAAGYQGVKAKKGLLMVWVPGIDMEDLLMSETWIESYRKVEIPNQIPNPNFNFSENPLGAYKALASALVETLYRFHKVTGRVHGDIKLDAFKVQYLDEEKGILDISPETGEMAVKLIDYDAAADIRASLAGTKPEEILGTWDFVSHRQVSPATVGGQDFRISAPNFFDDYVSLALMLAYLWMDPADVKTFLQRKQYAGHKELSADYHKRILGRSTRLEFIQEHGNLEGNPLKDWILDVLNLRPQLAQAGYSLDEVVRSYFIEVLTRSEMREGETAQPGIIRSSVENHADQLRAATVARILTRRKNLPQAEVLTADRVSGIVTEYEATINAHPYVRKVFDFRGNMEELRAGEQFGGQRRMIAFEGDKQLEFIQVRAVQIMPGDEDAGIINERDFIFIRNPNAAGNPIIGYAIIKEILHPQTSAGALGLNRNLTVAFHLFQGRDQTLLPSSREIYEAVAALGIQAHPQAERLAVNAASQIFHSNFETNENAAVEAQSARAGFYARMGFYSPSRQNLLNRYLFDTSTIDRKFNSKEMNALSAAQDTHWILNLMGRSEMREEEGQVKAPLGLPWNDPKNSDFAKDVKRIFVTGEYDIGNGAKLGYDAVRFAFLIPALLKRFPNATIEIEGVDFAQMFEHHREWSRIKPVSAPKGKYQLAIAQRSLSGKPADLNTDYFLDIVNLAVYGGARSELVDQNGKTILRKEISKTEEGPIFWNEAEAILKDWELIDGESELPLNIYNHPEVGGHQVDWMRLIRTADESDFFDRKISGKPIPLIFKQIMNYQTMNEIVTGKSNVVYVNLDAVTQEQTVNKAFWVQLLSKVLHANPNSHLMFSGGTSPSARSFAMSVAEELIAYSSGNQRIFVLPMIDSARLSQVWDFMAIADAVVTPNTGFMHMAHAAGRPLFVVDTSKEFTKHWSSPAERTEMVYLLDIKRIFSHHTALAEQYVAKLFEKTFALKEEYPRQSFQVGFEFTRFSPQFSRMMDSMRQAAERPEISPRERAWIEHYNQLLESGDTVKLGYQDFETHLQAYVTELTRDQNPSQIVVGTYDAQVVTKLIAEIEKKETSPESEAAGKLFLSYMLWHLQQGDSKNGTAFLKPITLSARSESRKLDAFQIKLLSDDWMSSEKNSRVRADAEEKLFAEELNLYVGILFRIINQEIGRQKVKISGTSLEDAIVVFMEANLSRIFPRGLSSRQLDDRKAALVKWMQENNKPAQEVLTVETMGAFDEIIYLALLDYQRMRLEFDHPELNNLGEVYSGQIFHTEKTATGVFASAPWSVVLKFFIALRALGVQLQGKQMLDFGAGDFRFGIAAANYFSMKADGYEINPSISDKTKELLRRFSGKQTANAAYYSSQDGDGLSDEADWGKYDLITYFYTEPSDPSEREMFRAKFLNKMQTMKPGAHIALLAIRNQIFNGILPLTDYQGSEWTLLNSSPIQLESGYDQPGIYLKVYRFNGRARSELRGVLLPENILDALQRGEEASATAPVIAALVAGGVVFAAGEATMENLHSVAGFIMPARSENRLSSILKLDGWHGDKKSVTIEFTTEQKLEELDIEDMRAILTANPDSRYGFIVKTGEIKSKWLELRSQYPKQFMIEVNDKAALNRGLSRILQGVGLEPIQITGLQQDLNEITILQTAIGSRRDIRLISYKEEDAEPRKHSIRIAQTVVAGQSTDIGDLREVSAELFEEENVNSWRIVSDVLSKIVGEITLQIQAQAKAAVSA